MLRQPPHVLIFHLFLICAVFIFPPLILFFSPWSRCLSSNPSLIPHYCLIIHKQTRHTALLVFVQWSWLSCVSAGFGLTSTKLVLMWGLCFWKPGEQVQPHWSLMGLKQNKKMSRWRGKRWKKRRVLGEQESTWLSLEDWWLLGDFTQFASQFKQVDFTETHAQLKVSFYLDQCKVIILSRATRTRSVVEIRQLPPIHTHLPAAITDWETGSHVAW